MYCLEWNCFGTAWQYAYWTQSVVFRIVTLSTPLCLILYRVHYRAKGYLQFIIARSKDKGNNTAVSYCVRWSASRRLVWPPCGLNGQRLVRSSKVCMINTRSSQQNGQTGHAAKGPNVNFRIIGSFKYDFCGGWTICADSSHCGLSVIPLGQNLW